MCFVFFLLSLNIILRLSLYDQSNTVGFNPWINKSVSYEGKYNFCDAFDLRKLKEVRQFR